MIKYLYDGKAYTDPKSIIFVEKPHFILKKVIKTQFFYFLFFLFIGPNIYFIDALLFFIELTNLNVTEIKSDVILGIFL